VADILTALRCARHRGILGNYRRSFKDTVLARLRSRWVLFSSGDDVLSALLPGWFGSMGFFFHSM
jgi:hypothetical protein